MAGTNNRAEIQRQQQQALETGNEEEIKKAVESAQQASSSARESAQQGGNVDDLVKQQRQLQEDAKNLVRQGGKDSTKDWGDSVMDATKAVGESASKSVQKLSPEFYKGVSNGIAGRPMGSMADAKAETAASQARTAQSASAKRDMEAQQRQQNADPQAVFGNAGKIATMQNDFQNMANIKGKTGMTGSAVSRLRNYNAPDVAQQQNLAQQNLSAAEQQREKSDEMQGEVDANIGLEKEYRIASRDYADDKGKSEELSLGENPGEEPKEEQEEETKEEETQQEEDTQQEEEPKEEPQEPQEPQQPQEPQEEPEEEQEPEKVVGNPQHVLNYITYGNDPTSRNYQMKAMSDDDKKLWEAWGKPEPLTEEDVAGVKGGFDGNIGQLQNVVSEKRADFWGKYIDATDDVRGIKSGNQKNLGSGVTAEQLEGMKAEATTGSDSRIKNIERELSDFHLKCIKEDYDAGRGITPEDFVWLAKLAGGKFKHNERDYDFFNDDDWNDDEDGSVLSGYAEHIRNFLYTYKPEAQEIDSSIDPDEEHIGPMAQDIEKVNPACVKETPEGVKTVDTARLALMNAGAIGDIARQLKELTSKLEELERAIQ